MKEKTYLLPCRKEFRVEREGPGADDDAVQRCIGWLLRATLYPTRVGARGHQKDEHSDQVFDADPSQEIAWRVSLADDIAGEPDDAGGRLAPAAPPVAAPSAAMASGTSPSSSSSSSSNSSISSSTAPAVPVELSGCCCGADHPGMSCAGWQAILEASLRQPHSGPGPGFQGTAPGRGRCELHGVLLRDVATDGDCMLHAFAAELARCYGATFAADGHQFGFAVTGSSVP